MYKNNAIKRPRKHTSHTLLTQSLETQEGIFSFACNFYTVTKITLAALFTGLIEMSF